MINTEEILSKVHKGFSLSEIIITCFVMAIIMLSISEFSWNVFAFSSKNSKVLEMTDQSRIFTERVTSQMLMASYIFPPGLEIYLSTDSSSFAINTEDSIAFLVEDGSSGDYIFYSFFISGDEFYEFRAKYPYTWVENTNPVSDFTYSYGVLSLLGTDVVASESTLSYSLNYENGITDKVLLGTIAAVDTTSINALIKSIEWDIKISKLNDKTMTIKGVSRNVPRYIQQSS